MAEKAAFNLVKNGRAAVIHIDPEGKDYNGLSLVAQTFADDIALVTGIRPEIETDARRLNGTVVIAGSIGNNAVIDAMISAGRLDVSSICNKRESFRILVVKNPLEGVAKALVVAGSDKRGTIYGLFHISELAGVSPWVYWADAVPEKKAELVFPESILNFTSREPSVKYRGIFLNDEWPSLGTWVTNTFGGFNEEFYDKVFTLILRLKGNFLWPAMWSAVFSEDGKESAISNARLADAYGIVMGTSHHEPMFRAGEEWRQVHKRYGESGEWNFTRNREAITRFWEDGAIRNKGFESLVTLGMRGERDSTLGGGIHENIELLKSIITTQKEILKKHGMADVPQVLTLYKEVEKYWYGTERTPGLKDWDVLDDVTIMLAEDNFGNVRTLPSEEERNRAAGWGMYYHVDYHGGPVSYEWVNTTPIEKIWEQMSMAYDYGVRNIWLLNVGDLKPMELPMSYFLDLAYDFDAWGTDGINRTQEYAVRWVRQQFNNPGVRDIAGEIAGILSGYARMNGIRKPEALYSDTFSIVHYGEARRVLARAAELENNAAKYFDRIPESLRDTYYQLVYYPAVASVNVVKMQIYAGFNKRCRDIGSVLANRYAESVERAIELDKQMQEYFNNTLSNGKWRGIMSSAHVGYVRWNSEGWRYPGVSRVKPVSGASMIVDVEGLEEAYSSGTADLPPFTGLRGESRSITIGNRGDVPFNFKAQASVDWITLDSSEGIVTDGTTIMVSVKPDRIRHKSRGHIDITGAGQTVRVNVAVKAIETGSLPEMTFIGNNGVVSIEAGHARNRVSKTRVEWKVIENYGRTLSSVKMFPTTVSFEKAEDAPYLEYGIYIDEDGEYTLTAYAAPSNNLTFNGQLRYGVSFDGSSPIVADTLPPGFIAGDHANKPWCDGVLDNIHLSRTTHHLTKGLHVLRFHGLDAGVVLQKLVLHKGELPASYLGPEESFFICRE